MKKKWIKAAGILMAVATVLSLASCSKKNKDAEAETTTEAVETTPAVTTGNVVRTGSEGLSFSVTGNGECTLTGLGSCTDTAVSIPATDENGNLLPDEVRLTGYGKALRSTSLDELPELINIFIGNMSIVGPRPQLVRDMVFMTAEQRRRHSVTPGLTGLAQCSGRNNMSWEKKFEYDLKYIEKITLLGDIRILFKTVFKVFKRDGITEEGMATAADLGDYLLTQGTVSQPEYDQKQQEAKELVLNK
jgi:hypothetical protein